MLSHLNSEATGCSATHFIDFAVGRQLDTTGWDRRSSFSDNIKFYKVLYDSCILFILFKHS